METISIKEVFKNYKSLDEVRLVGWVRSNRDSGSIGFISFFDGTCINSVQLVYKKTDTENFDEARTVRTGSAIMVEGKVVPSIKENQNFEILLKGFKILKQSDEDYPLQKKEHTSEFLRSIAHLRQRTNKFNTVMKIRSEIAFAIHNFFHQNDFVWVSTPIITSNDAEGAGENFYVSSKEKNFFDKNATLTVSGQLHAEAYAQAYKRVYTFGPTFRAEKSNTNRHISEFWMVEPEVAFCDINQLMFLIETFVKYLIRFALKNCKEEIAFLNKSTDSGLAQRLLDVVDAEFVKVEYKEAIRILKSKISEGHRFEDNDIYFGKDLASEHEKYLCEVIYNKPVFLYNFPQEIKAFYMKQNHDGTTVAACDLLVPGIGEIVGGSQREDDYKKIVKRCQSFGIKTDEIDWYLNLRRYGYFKSSGFGLGFERFLMYITGINNIKDVIPFPRSYGPINF
ncbi:asparagine--tRNA ligase [Malacoplasma muris]|uniref:asparagine--tRNA ligase n=1 Tax=Malacoplasma muris TaxID=2119 RepID=UPI00398E6AB5